MGRATNLHKASNIVRADSPDGTTDSEFNPTFTTEISTAIFNSLHVRRAQRPATTVKNKTGRYPWEWLPTCRYICNINSLATFRALVNEWERQQEPRRVSLETLCSYMKDTYGPGMVYQDIGQTKRRFFGRRAVAASDELGSTEGFLEAVPNVRTRVRQRRISTPTGPNRRRPISEVSRMSTRSTTRRRTRLENDTPADPELPRSAHRATVAAACPSSDTEESSACEEIRVCSPRSDTTSGSTSLGTTNTGTNHDIDRIRMDLQNEVRTAADAITQQLESATTALSEWQGGLPKKRKEIKQAENKLQGIKNNMNQAALLHAKSNSACKDARASIEEIRKELAEANANFPGGSPKRLADIRSRLAKAKLSQANALGAFNIAQSIMDEWIRRKTEAEAKLTGLRGEVRDEEARGELLQTTLKQARLLSTMNEVGLEGIEELLAKCPRVVASSMYIVEKRSR
ncbi:Hypothetical protein NCS54_00814500 [Fusarium falciforme]|uniref:Hypothetical protein n=1 Tax=Fusarium falciforme TaxID=195108 RepID=UPI0023001A22|nr:Hypothetical protein NCS54_00814500 [Fusarium falciforme]WAO90708.1 Hypothetical protein NCS54_00814500 [Fusarium falciforme]